MSNGSYHDAEPDVQREVLEELLASVLRSARPLEQQPAPIRRHAQRAGEGREQRVGGQDGQEEEADEDELKKRAVSRVCCKQANEGKSGARRAVRKPSESHQRAVLEPPESSTLSSED